MLRRLRRLGWLLTAAGRAEIRALFVALRDPRAPFAARALVLLALIYVLWPLDLAPEVIPVVGWLDDLTIDPLLLWAAARVISVPRLQRRR